MIHKVVVGREINFPFSPYWVCTCGYRFKAAAMSQALFDEFAKHVEESI